MTLLLWICSVPLIAEFAFAPFNLWSGRTMPNFTRYTGMPPALARNVLAPVKLLGALLLALGLAFAGAGVGGAGVIALVSCFYLWRLAGRGRRHADGLAAFGLTLVLAIALLALQLSR